MSDRQKINETKQKAYSCNLKLAKAGDRVGQHQVALAYYDGEGVKQDKQKAFDWLLKSAQQGYYRAQCDVAFCYHFGVGVSVDKEEAFRWRLKAAKQEKDMIISNKATSWYDQTFFDMEHYRSPIYNVAMIFHVGEGISEGYFCSAVYDVACCYYSGEGVERNREEAFNWFLIAAQQRHIEAIIVLLYVYGKDDIDTDCFNHLTMESVRYGLTDYWGNLEQLNEILYGNSENWPVLDKFQKFQLFIHYLEVGIGSDVPEDWYEVGNCYNEGWGIEKSKENAFRWYLIAAKGGHSDAQLIVAEMYKKGDEIEKNLDEAERWHAIARENKAQEKKAHEMDEFVRFLLGNSAENPNQAIQH